MIALFRKEIASFFNSLTGYLVLLVFIVINGLFLWVIPGNSNILDSGYANVDTLFSMAPWVFLFLVPAVTMRMISEEKKTGTLEILLTKPLSDFNIIFAKYSAAIILVLMALIPTLVFVLSVYLLGNPVGNIDMGATMGSYIGLFFLASVYAASGILASSLTDNQIIAFVLAVVISIFLYLGFEALATLGLFKGIDYFLVQLGIANHYASLSRGVVDTRDIIYFIVVDGILLLTTRLVFQSRKW